MARKKSRKFMFLTLLAAIVGMGAYSFSVMSRPASSLDPSNLATVEWGDLARSVVAIGRIEPISKVEIKSKANGIIEDLKVDVGDLVRAGEVLVELDKENLAARLRETRAALMGAEANFQAAEAELEKSEIEAEDVEVAFARRNTDRAELLLAEGLIGQQAFDESRSALEQAQNRQRAARTQLNVTRARAEQARANIAQSQASVERAEEELDNASIRSPIDGMVLSRGVEIGSPVSSILNMGAAATLVMVLGNIDEVFVRGQVDEADVGEVRLDQPARIRVEAFRERLFEGRLTQISPLGVEENNVVSFEVRVSIDNAAGELRANMSADAEIILEEHLGTLIVPEAAITYDADRTAWVEVPSPGGEDPSRRQAIEVGVSNGTRTQVLKGLDEGDQVILP